MRQRTKNFIIGAAIGSAATAALVDSDSVKRAASHAYYKAHTFIMDKAVRTFPQMFPFPELISGQGCTSKLPEVLAKYKITNVMIVTGPRIGKTLVSPLVEQIEASGISCTVFAKTEANPSVDTVEEIRGLYLANNCNGFLAIGGGSPMDAAKGAAARIARPHTDIVKMAGVLKVMHPVAPIICVPTTSGTGSEASIGAVITDSETHHKYAISDPFLTPKAAVLDPELTVSMPPFVTATTGMDALTHAVEAYITRAYNTDFTNKCCEEAIADVFKYLEVAYNDGSNIEARDHMLHASYKAGLAFTRAGLGYVHGIAHAIGGLYGTAHGLANAVLLPEVLMEYGQTIDPKLAHLAEITGVKIDGTEKAKAHAFVQAIRGLNEKLGLPAGFDFVQKSDYETITMRAIHEASNDYPVPVLFDEEQIYNILNRISL